MNSDHSEEESSSSSSAQEPHSDEENKPVKRTRRKKKFELRDGGVWVSHGTELSDRITLNVALTHYEVIGEVAEEFGWKIQHRMHRKKGWDVLWTDQLILPEVLMRMKPHQKVSHFPGIHVLARKNLLGLSLMEMRGMAPEEYDFFPKTWLLPSQFPELRRQLEGPDSKPKIIIVKPEADCQGRGIFLAQGLDGLIKGRHYVVQEYIDRPLLIEGLKFDCRIYVLLCGVAPMRLYVYQEGLARLATQKYQAPTSQNLKHQYMHLTNYAVNKQNPNFVYNASSQRMDVGHKRSLSSVMQMIHQRGYNMEAVQANIDAVIVKTLLLGHPLACHQYRFCQPEDLNRNMCFHILGVDIMLDEDCKPWVLEVNHTPSFATDTPLDHHIKLSLIKDTLSLLNINIATRKQGLQRQREAKEEAKIRKGSKRQLYENTEKQEQVKQAQEARDLYENQHLGNYRKIYPAADEMRQQVYEQLMAAAEKAYFAQNNVLRAQMDKEKAAESGSSPVVRKSSFGTDQSAKQSQQMSGSAELANSGELNGLKRQGSRGKSNQGQHVRQKSSNQRQSIGLKQPLNDLPPKPKALQKPSMSSNNAIGKIGSAVRQPQKPSQQKQPQKNGGRTIKQEVGQQRVKTTVSRKVSIQAVYGKKKKVSDSGESQSEDDN